MTRIEDDPAPAKVTPPSEQEVLAKFIMDELCEVAKKWMKVDPLHERLSSPLVLTPNKPSPRRRGLGRKTQPIPIVKEVWLAGVSLAEDAESMAITVGTDGTPYCSYYELNVGTRSIVLTPEFLATRDVATLTSILAEIREKKATLELQMPVER